jgi:hypothetical protein
MVGCPVPRRDCLRYYCHHRAMEFGRGSNIVMRRKGGDMEEHDLSDY